MTIKESKKPREFHIEKVDGVDPPYIAWDEISAIDCGLIHVREVPTGCVQCNGIILADTEDWLNPLCYSCYSEHFKSENKMTPELDLAIKNMRNTLDKCFLNDLSPFGTAHDAMIENAISEYDKAVGRK